MSINASADNWLKESRTQKYGPSDKIAARDRWKAAGLLAATASYRERQRRRLRQAGCPKQTAVDLAYALATEFFENKGGDDPPWSCRNMDEGVIQQAADEFTKTLRQEVTRQGGRLPYSFDTGWVKTFVEDLVGEFAIEQYQVYEDYLDDLDPDAEVADA